MNCQAPDTLNLFLAIVAVMFSISTLATLSYLVRDRWPVIRPPLTKRNITICFAIEVTLMIWAMALL